MMIAICTVLGVIILTMIYLSLDGFKLVMGLCYILITVYFVFFIVSMLIVILSREE